MPAAYVDLQPGTRIKVSPPGDPLGPSYEATVRSVMPNGLRLAMPRRAQEVLAVQAGDHLTMFTTLQGRVYRFSVDVRLSEVDNDSFVIDPPQEAERTERRHFYRLVTRIAPRHTARLDDSGREVQVLRTVILDLSGGGALLQTREFIPAGSRLRLVFELDGDPLEMDVAALVLNVMRPSPHAQHYRVHCQFLEPDQSEIERLVRYVYRQQAELRRRGVI